MFLREFRKRDESGVPEAYYVFECKLSAIFDREVRCGHRNSFVVLVLVVVVGIPLSKIMVLHYFSAITLF